MLRRVDPLSYVVIALGLITGIAVLFDWQTPFRPLLVLAFVVFAPGWVIVQLLPLRGKLAQLVIAVALSISLAITASLVLLYVKQWSPIVGFAMLYLVTILGIAARYRSDNSSY